MMHRWANMVFLSTFSYMYAIVSSNGVIIIKITFALSACLKDQQLEESRHTVAEEEGSAYSKDANVTNRARDSIGGVILPITDMDSSCDTDEPTSFTVSVHSVPVHIPAPASKSLGEDDCSYIEGLLCIKHSEKCIKWGSRFLKYFYIEHLFWYTGK